MRDLVARAAAAVSSSPSGSSGGGGGSQGPIGLDPTKVTPGIQGFVAIFALVLVTILLIRSMVGRIRRIRYRAAREGELDDGPGLPEQAPQPRPQRAPRRIGPAAADPGAEDGTDRRQQGEDRGNPDRSAQNT